MLPRYLNIVRYKIIITQGNPSYEVMVGSPEGSTQLVRSCERLDRALRLGLLGPCCYFEGDGAIIDKRNLLHNGQQDQMIPLSVNTTTNN